MQINLSNDELNVVRYALDQHIMTLTKICQDDKEIQPSIAQAFQRYCDQMSALLDKLPE